MVKSALAKQESVFRTISRRIHEHATGKSFALILNLPNLLCCPRRFSSRRLVSDSLLFGSCGLFLGQLIICSIVLVNTRRVPRGCSMRKVVLLLLLAQFFLGSRLRFALQLRVARTNRVLPSILGRCPLRNGIHLLLRWTVVQRHCVSRQVAAFISIFCSFNFIHRCCFFILKQMTLCRGSVFFSSFFFRRVVFILLGRGGGFLFSFLFIIFNSFGLRLC
mmetsp:Transcript_175/g.333  ORF Transcript_175/g.333 Transcript_175/m.333 type:complete len:220 (+) Transcript_175:390-1049(+)